MSSRSPLFPASFPAEDPASDPNLLPRPIRRSANHLALPYVRTVLLAVGLALLIRVSVVEAFKIPSGSMEETILPGDRVVANKFLYGTRLPLIGLRTPALREPRAGEILIFRSPNEDGATFIKRCVAVGGQMVTIRDKVLYVDGKRVSLPPGGKIDPARHAAAFDDYGPVRVPANHLFMLGDNRDNSSDSRVWGFLDRRLVIGKAMAVYWSLEPNDAKSVWRRIRWDRIGERIL
ncbi:MAG: signal peptidase I [Candidatus Eisenbacteria bacterium]|nr:signal peptidase I [Candidatus Eisenbacteria bacterium]